jgi:hypothetical protein
LKLPCDDCGDVTSIDEGEYQARSALDRSTIFRCNDCVWKRKRAKFVEEGKSKILMVSESEQYLLFEEICNRHDLVFNRFREDNENPDTPLNLHFTYTPQDSESQHLIFKCIDLHNKNPECQDFYESDWMMFLNDETDVIDLYFTVQCWDAETKEDVTLEFDFDDPFLQELLKLAREKWPFYDGDEGREKTVKLLTEQKIGTVLWNQYDLVFSEEQRQEFAAKRSDIEKLVDELEKDEE